MRRQHWLAPNKMTELPHSAAWVDTETDQAEIAPGTIAHSLRFGWACYQRTWECDRWTEPEWCRFTRPTVFWEWLEARLRPRTRTFLFAHNWSFDAPVLDTFTILRSRGWTLGTAVIESPPVILVWRRETCTIEMLDTLNWWRMSLSAVGESIGVPKLDFPLESASKKEWDIYCRNDVEVIRRAMHSWWSFLRRYDLGGFARTLAGQAMRSFRHRFMRHPILVDNDERSLSLARSALHGGRTESFRLGRIPGPVHCLDVNSMYPAVMRDNEYPSILKCHCIRATVSEVRRWCVEYCCIARVRLDTDSPQYAHVVKGKLIFPVGRIITSLTTPDLIEAIDQGHVDRIEEVAVYERAPLFRYFVEEFYGLRLAAGERKDEVSRWMLKILMNSLYGKFAQRGGVWNTVGATDENDVATWVEVDGETGQVFHRRRFAGILQERSDEAEAYTSHPAIAAHVTAYARRRLWRLMARAGRRHVFYVDTDSLYVDDQGLRNLKEECNQSRLGALKLEHSYPWIVLRGLKDYETPERLVVKGVRKKARWIDDHTVEQEEWSTLTGLIRQGQLSAPTTTRKLKTLSREYTKGSVASSGRASPLRLREW